MRSHLSSDNIKSFNGIITDLHSTPELIITYFTVHMEILITTADPNRKNHPKWPKFRGVSPPVELSQPRLMPLPPLGA